MKKVLLLMLTLITLTGCADHVRDYIRYKFTYQEENFDGWGEEVKWGHSGTVYLLEEENRGKVLCFGGVGESIPAGSDEVGIAIDVLTPGIVLDFDYKVKRVGQNARFVVTNECEETEHILLECDQPTSWQSASFTITHIFCTQLLFKAERVEADSQGVVVCIDNFRVRPVRSAPSEELPPIYWRY